MSRNYTENKEGTVLLRLALTYGIQREAKKITHINNYIFYVTGILFLNSFLSNTTKQYLYYL